MECEFQRRGLWPVPREWLADRAAALDKACIELCGLERILERVRAQRDLSLRRRQELLEKRARDRLHREIGW